MNPARQEHPLSRETSLNGGGLRMHATGAVH